MFYISTYVRVKNTNYNTQTTHNYRHYEESGADMFEGTEPGLHTYVGSEHPSYTNHSS